MSSGWIVCGRNSGRSDAVSVRRTLWSLHELPDEDLFVDRSVDLRSSTAVVNLVLAAESQNVFCVELKSLDGKLICWAEDLNIPTETSPYHFLEIDRAGSLLSARC